MIQALRLSLERPNTQEGKEAIATLVKSFDTLLQDYNIDPIMWMADEEDTRFIFTAYIPPDCLPELDIAADFIEDTFAEYTTA